MACYPKRCRSGSGRQEGWGEAATTAVATKLLEVATSILGQKKQVTEAQVFCTETVAGEGGAGN